MSAIYTGGFMAQEDTAKGMSMVQRPMNGGVQRQYKFSNGYGASVITVSYTHLTLPTIYSV